MGHTFLLLRVHSGCPDIGAPVPGLKLVWDQYYYLLFYTSAYYLDLLYVLPSDI